MLDSSSPPPPLATITTVLVVNETYTRLPPQFVALAAYETLKLQETLWTCKDKISELIFFSQIEQIQKGPIVFRVFKYCNKESSSVLQSILSLGGGVSHGCQLGGYMSTLWYDSIDATMHFTNIFILLPRSRKCSFPEESLYAQISANIEILVLMPPFKNKSSLMYI